MEMYCLKCEAKTETIDVQNITSKNGRSMLKGICSVCRRYKTQFVKAERGGDLVSSLNSVTSNIKLPWAKFKGEVHLPGMNFAGPGTRLDLRLNDDNSYKNWSKPVDRVDNAAYHHDLAYAEHSDTASRNVADREMIRELNNIDNPTVRERVERAIVIPILATKQSFGLGVKTASKKKRRLN